MSSVLVSFHSARGSMQAASKEKIPMFLHSALPACGNTGITDKMWALVL